MKETQKTASCVSRASLTGFPFTRGGAATREATSGKLRHRPLPTPRSKTKQTGKFLPVRLTLTREPTKCRVRHHYAGSKVCLFSHLVFPHRQSTFSSLLLCCSFRRTLQRTATRRSALSHPPAQRATRARRFLFSCLFPPRDRRRVVNVHSGRREERTAIARHHYGALHAPCPLLARTRHGFFVPGVLSTAPVLLHHPLLNHLTQHDHPSKKRNKQEKVVSSSFIAATAGPARAACPRTASARKK
jgi:hypothetical protein